MKRLVFLIILIFGAGTLSAENIGTVSFTAGKVQIKQGSEWINAKAGMKFSQTSEIQTGLKSLAILNFNNGNRLKIQAGTMISMASYTEGSYGNATNVNLKMGKITAIVSKPEEGKNHFRVRTPTVVAGVRGTIEEISYTPEGGTQIFLVESSAEVFSQYGRFIVGENNSGKVGSHGDNVSQGHENRRNHRSVRAANPSLGSTEVRAFIRDGRPSPGANITDRNLWGDKGIEIIRSLPLDETVEIGIEKL